MKSIVILCLVTLASGIITTENYDFSASLLEGKMKLFWKIEKDVITFEVHGNTTGWVGVGLSSNGRMKGADIYIGWVADNKVYLTDRYGIGYVAPPKDTENNVKLISGSEQGGWTTLKFSRKLISPDKEHDMDITSDTQRVIFALGSTDPVKDDPSTFIYHGPWRRGTKSLQLVKRKISLSENETYDHINIIHKNFEVPQRETFYSCFLFKLPEIKEKHHVVQVEPIIQKENARYVHHLILSTCLRDHFVPDKDWDKPFACRSSRHPRSCGKMIMGWAVGGETVNFPRHVGLPIFGDGDKYLMMEIHYDNPEAKQGIIDNSGLKLIYTSTLRKYDAGILPVGTDYYSLGVYIPPQSPNFLQASHCSSACLSQQLGDRNSIYAFGDFLHTHLAGKAVRVRHFRNGKELPMIAKDDSYDFDFQHFRLFSKEIEIKSTDHLEVDCYYDTMNRHNVTLGGESTRQEMCFAFILYYPDTSNSFCQSRPSIRELFKFLNITQFWFDYASYEYRVFEPLSHRGKSVVDYLNQIDWTPTLIEEFSQAQRKLTQFQYCYAPRFRDITLFPIKMPKEVLEN